MTPDRATIVAKLRREADRIEAGGEPSLYCRHLDPDDDLLTTSSPDTIDEARQLIALRLCDGFWPEDTDLQEWGVTVPVESVEIASHRHATPAEGVNDWIVYRLVDPDTYTGPEIEPHECPDCGDEVRRAPGEPCPNECRVCGHHGPESASGGPCPACACTEAT